MTEIVVVRDHEPDEDRVRALVDLLLTLHAQEASEGKEAA